MTGRRMGREAARTRFLAAAGPSDRLLVVTFRRWLDGPEGQAAVWNGLATQLGVARARRFLAAFEAYLGAVSGGLRRPMIRHASHCPCLGEDEALFAGIVGAARRGDRESALGQAADIVRDADVVAIVERAERLGMLLEEIGAEPVSGAEARARLH